MKVESTDAQIEILRNAWPTIRADDTVKCFACKHTGKPDSRAVEEWHGEITLEVRCEACFSLDVYPVGAGE